MAKVLKDIEHKTYIRMEAFQQFCQGMFKCFNGTWEDNSANYNLEKDFEEIVSQLIVRDIVCGGNKESLAVFAGFFKDSLKATLKNAYTSNIGENRRPQCEEKDYIYEIFARFVARKTLTDEALKNAVVSLYADKFQEEYKLVSDYAATFGNESNDKNDTTMLLYSIFARASNEETDPDETRFYAVLLFLNWFSQKCGHTLPYKKIDASRYFPPARTIDADEIAAMTLRPFEAICHTYDRINGFESEQNIADKDIPEKIGTAMFTKATEPTLAAFSTYGDIKKKDSARLLLHNKYMRERLRLLAENLGCEFYKDDLKKSKDVIAAKLWEAGYIDNQWNAIAYGIIAERSSCRKTFAFDSLENSEKEDKEAYVQMMSEDLLDMYFTTKLESKLREMSDTSAYDLVTRRDIIKEIGVDDIDKDAGFLTNMSYVAAAFKEMNAVYGMYIDEADLLGENESDNLRYRHLYKEEVKKKERKIEEQKQEIESLKNVINALSKNDDQKTDRSEKKLIREIKRLEGLLLKKDGEVDEAEKRSAELLEYIELIESGYDAEEETIDVSVNISDLQQKRFVFVCDNIDNIYPELRRRFKDSIFMESLNASPAYGKIDAVVFVTRHISHSLYFKAKSMYDGIPMIHFTRKNIDEMYRTIATELKIA